MREIKFRVWDGERMWTASDDYFSVQFSSDLNMMHYYDPSEDDWKECGLEGPRIGANLVKASWKYTENPLVFMQFTGLHDSEGTEIYEGDRLTTNLRGGRDVPILDHYTVVFDEGQFYPFGVCGPEGGYECCPLSPDKTLVIGNIYEDKCPT